MKNTTGNNVDLLIPIDDITKKHPDILSRGVMHGIPSDVLLKLIFHISSIIPKNYISGNLDSNICDAIMDSIGFVSEDHIGSIHDLNDLARADLELFFHEVIEVAIDVFYMLTLNSSQFIVKSITKGHVLVTADFTPIEN